MPSAWDEDILNKLLIKQEQPNTNPTQTQHKLDTKPNTNLTQTQHSKTQTQHKPNTQPNTIRHTNLTQTAHKPNTNSPFSSIVGLQRQITIFVYSLCKISRSKTTEQLTVEYIAESLGIRTGSIKTTLARLEQKEIIIKVNYKNGRAGWVQYELPNDVYNEILQAETQHKLDTNLTQTAHKPNTQLNTQPNTTLSSSSSNNINLKTTTTSELPVEWLAIDFEPLQHIGFTQTHVKQVAIRKLLTPDELQQSIYAYAWNLENNTKSNSTNPIKEPLSYLMSIFNKGIVVTPGVGYESPEIASKRLLSEFLKKEAQERRKLDQQIFDDSFTIWHSKLTDAEAKALLPSGIKYSRTSKIAEETLKVHFRENVYEEG